MLDAQDDREVTELLTAYDRVVARLDELGIDVAARARMNARWHVGERVRVRMGVKPTHYVGRTGVVERISDGWVYVPGAQSMGQDPAGFREDELEAA